MDTGIKNREVDKKKAKAAVHVSHAAQGASATGAMSGKTKH